MYNSTLEFIKALAANDIEAAKRYAEPIFREADERRKSKNLPESSTEGFSYAERSARALLHGNKGFANKMALSHILSDEAKEIPYYIRSRLYWAIYGIACKASTLPFELSEIATLKYPAMSDKEFQRYHPTDEVTQLSSHIASVFLSSCVLDEEELKYANTTLLCGKNGMGKTSFARYVARTLDLPLLYVDFSMCMEAYPNTTMREMTALFRYAEENRCVLMLDNLSTIDVPSAFIIGAIKNIANHVILIAAAEDIGDINGNLFDCFKNYGKLSEFTLKDAKKYAKGFFRSLGVDNDSDGQTLVNGLGLSTLLFWSPSEVERRITRIIEGQYLKHPDLAIAAALGLYACDNSKGSQTTDNPSPDGEEE